MNGRILLVSGFVALSAIIGILVLAAAPSKPLPATVAEASLTEQAHAATAAHVQPAVAEAKPEGPFVIKRILPIDGPIKYGEWHWDDKNVPDGPIVVTVDLDARVLSIFKDGYEIGATAVLIGAPSHPTPLGVFPIMSKERHHTSNLYDAEMPYMQRLTNDGITLHSSKVEVGYASHGCIGMPDAFAAKLFATTHVGDKVIITRGKQVGMGAQLIGG